MCIRDRSMDFPEPVIRVAIEPKTKAGQEKMGIALAKLAEELSLIHILYPHDHTVPSFFKAIV